jgi:oligopeptide transport system ATP-binding protein
MTLLEVKDLHVHFKMDAGLLHAVRGVSFSLKAGETLGVVGESGCGKSAMAKSLVGLLSKETADTAGDILYKDQNLSLFKEKEMQKIRGKEIAMVFQDPMTSLNPTLKVGFQIVEGFLRHHPDTSLKTAQEYAIEMLELVGIPQARERMEEYPHTLSGGMRQRVMIALALASRPQLLIADEPTTALDVTIQAQILDLMKNIQRKTGTSIILITHDLSVVAGFCDRVMVMYGGKIVEEAPVEQLFASPQHPYTVRLLQSKPRLDMSEDTPLLSIEGTPPDLSLPIQGCSFCPRCPYAMNICSQQPPPFYQSGNDHRSACWKHDRRAHG